MKTTNFRTKLAEKHDNSSLWTVRDALEEAIRCIDAGEMNPTRMILTFSTSKPEDGEHAEDLDHFYVNVDQVTRVAIASATLQRETEMYRGLYR